VVEMPRVDVVEEVHDCSSGALVYLEGLRKGKRVRGLGMRWSKRETKR